MKWGMIVRGEDRGLGHLTWEMHRNLQPDRTLLMDLGGGLARGFPVHPDRYPSAVVVPWDGSPLEPLWEQHIRAWLGSLDVLYSAETFYDWRIVDWAREAGCATVLHAMPEFYRQGTPGDGLPIPDVVWAPTTWRLDQLPVAARLVPVPVALDRFTAQDGHDGDRDGPLRVLHVAGHRAAGDRNGTNLVLRSLPEIRGEVHLTIAGQDERLPAVPNRRRRSGLMVTSRPKGCANYWDLYAGHDVLLLPRRYGGLSLPVQEGMAAGLVPVMTDVSPNRDWPIVPVPAVMSGTIAAPGGVILMAACRPAELAVAVSQLGEDAALLGCRRGEALVWARTHSWEALAPLYREELERAR